MVVSAVVMICLAILVGMFTAAITGVSGAVYSG